jgi:hypothetical protein
MVYAVLTDFGRCAFVSFLSFAGFSKTMLSKHTKSRQSKRAD